MIFHQSNHLTFIVHKNQQVVFRKNNVLDKSSARHADRQKHNGLTPALMLTVRLSSYCHDRQ
ncbi:hypothetical protein EU383_16065 [Salmonella enterica subsp. enterica serovar Napoli]|uniref:Uncharacterized protein n=1 Tax=Salmonella enterica subsp. enterica serovar Napoli TaxID=1151001 RepID=A0A5I5V9H5_SALET|nr:hypothetical protein [Salmonella enterica subsp. enterica serovar Napoli]EAA6341223.1 hypothetical protein [Salmonella enterica subsp. enterica serovar Veneziana]EAC0523846.1 hypothetical protein [Salmonella enterica subsp. enterica serovar Zaiman]EAU6666453.1 hypothetical protein [Salmonella enterica]EBN0191633.1 hypothetical protein [Salmonella enterica subsp. enterica serovar Enteritidis]ECF7023899.1 hypothetical protein [Salmonella enterica subsp. enterica]ECY8074588.1 hypothetical pro